MNAPDAQLHFDVDGRSMTCRVLRAARRTYALRLAPDGRVLDARLAAGDRQVLENAAAVVVDDDEGEVDLSEEDGDGALDAGALLLCPEARGHIALHTPHAHQRAVLLVALAAWIAPFLLERRRVFRELEARCRALGLPVEWRERLDVPVEHGWDRESFLRHTCEKAGLRPGEQHDLSALRMVISSAG